MWCGSDAVGAAIEDELIALRVGLSCAAVDCLQTQARDVCKLSPSLAGLFLSLLLRVSNQIHADAFLKISVRNRT
jgi:hypothetical protein